MVAESAIADGMGGNPSNNVQTALIKPGASTAPTATVTGSRQESVAGPRLAVV
jgi:hypothetical protein